MKILLLTLVIVAVAQAAVMERRHTRRRPLPIPMSYIPIESNDRIVGGAPAQPSAHPHQVSIQRRSGGWYHSCGGSIIDTRWVITAAHCVDDNRPKKIRVVAGIYNLDDTQSADRKKVSKIIVHKDYDTYTLANDIALLELSVDIGDSNNQIIISSNDVPDGKLVTVTGWGTLSEGGISPKELHEVQVPIINNDVCASMLPSADELHRNEMFCAGYQQGGKDSCQGDSGGPVVYNNELVGLVSWGYGCARANSPGIYTRLSNYQDWIAANKQ